MLELRLDDRLLPLPYTIDPSVTTVSFAGAPQTAGARSSWTVGFTSSSTGTLVGRLDDHRRLQRGVRRSPGHAGDRAQPGLRQLQRDGDHCGTDRNGHPRRWIVRPRAEHSRNIDHRRPHEPDRGHLPRQHVQHQDVRRQHERGQSGRRRRRWRPRRPRPRSRSPARRSHSPPAPPGRPTSPPAAQARCMRATRSPSPTPPASSSRPPPPSSSSTASPTARPPRQGPARSATITLADNGGTCLLPNSRAATVQILGVTNGATLGAVAADRQDQRRLGCGECGSRHHGRCNGADRESPSVARRSPSAFARPGRPTSRRARAGPCRPATRSPSPTPRASPCRPARAPALFKSGFINCSATVDGRRHRRHGHARRQRRHLRAAGLERRQLRDPGCRQPAHDRRRPADSQDERRHHRCCRNRGHSRRRHLGRRRDREQLVVQRERPRDVDGGLHVERIRQPPRRRHDHGHLPRDSASRSRQARRSSRCSASRRSAR